MSKSFNVWHSVRNRFLAFGALIGPVFIDGDLAKIKMEQAVTVFRERRSAVVATVRNSGRRALVGLSLTCALLASAGCDAQSRTANSLVAVQAATIEQEQSTMWMTVGERRFEITLEDNATARGFAGMLPLTLNMSEHNGNEKYADLPQTLPTDASRPGTIRNGDIMLYGNRTLVVFYETFNSGYSYTRIGRVADPDGLAQALGRRGAQVAFSNQPAAD